MSTLSDDDKMGYLPEQDIDTTIHAAPLAELETPKKRKWMQTLSVLIAGVALFSDGYNIQITGTVYFLHVISRQSWWRTRLYEHRHGKALSHRP